jgi:poly(hydroxyalkanoate) granule-associated protein
MKSGKKARKTSRVDQSHNRVLETLNQVWLAGLGAVSRSQAAGPKMLNELAKEGTHIQARTRAVAGNAVRDVQARVHHALNQLPPVLILKEIRALAKRIGAIDSKIDKLASARRSPRKARVVRKRRQPR